MKPIFLTGFLIGANALLVLGLTRQTPQLPPEIPKAKNGFAVSAPAPKVPVAPRKPAPAPQTPFAAIFSSDPKQFVTNLRAIGCPEETIKEILVAEISRRYALQENALRPTPADHVPWGWSPKTSEGKIIARRQEAAAIAREKQATLRNALGYDVAVNIPNYAMTTSDQVFEDTLKSLPAEKRVEAQAAQEKYWAEVQILRDRTRGFWQPEDVAALKELKDQRKAALQQLGAQ